MNVSNLFFVHMLVRATRIFQMVFLWKEFLCALVLYCVCLVYCAWVCIRQKSMIFSKHMTDWKEWDLAASILAI